jgi:hypothetical protein
MGLTEPDLRALAERVIAGDPSLRQTRHRWVNRTEHTVWIVDDRVVIKKYTLHPGKQNRWKVWEKEHRALERLHGLSVQTCLGYLSLRQPDGLPAHFLFKEFLRGEDVASIVDASIGEFANLRAAIHARGVVTNDPTAANLIRTDAGRLAFIDFGRATVYPLRGPVYWWYLGKELSRTYRKALRSAPDAMAVYGPHYFAALGHPSGWRRQLLATAFRYWCARKKVAAPAIFP